jgi:hypothetical protein
VKAIDKHQAVTKAFIDHDYGWHYDNFSYEREDDKSAAKVEDLAGARKRRFGEEEWGL